MLMPRGFYYVSPGKKNTEPKFCDIYDITQEAYRLADRLSDAQLLGYKLSRFLRLD